jgi:cell division cycle 20, cofactor of APC complex
VEKRGISDKDTATSHVPLLSRSASFTAFSVPRTPVIPSYQDRYGVAMNEGFSMLRRSISMTLSETSTISYPETSAYHFLRDSKVTIDFTPPSNEPCPIALSSQNLLFFTRGIRVYHKPILSNDSGDIVSQLCRIPDTLGDLRGIACGGAEYANTVALGTSKGYIQIYDVSTKKTTAQWSTKDFACMAWSGHVLSVGTVKGTIRHFDLRIKERAKMKEQARKVTRHQARISSLAWSEDGKMMASGDENGTIFCWDPRQRAPLDVGELVQRRRKMQHTGAITVRIRCTVDLDPELILHKWAGLSMVSMEAKIIGIRRFIRRRQGYFKDVERCIRYLAVGTQLASTG